jgi:hypothetical protein
MCKVVYKIKVHCSFYDGVFKIIENKNQLFDVYYKLYHRETGQKYKLWISIFGSFEKALNFVKKCLRNAAKETFLYTLCQNCKKRYYFPNISCDNLTHELNSRWSHNIN